MSETPIDSLTHVPMPRRTALAQLGVGAVAAIAPASLRASVAADAPTADTVDVARLLRLAGVPSISYAIVDGERITTQSVGVRRMGDADQATADTVYAAASLTKAVFAYLFLGLVVDGTISLDKPVREYLALPNPDDERATRITARHLLSHSGGWRNWRFDPKQSLTADFEPGSKWGYSGEGYFFLQRVAETVSGKSVSVLAREQLFTPLGMTRSSMVETEALEPYLAAGHTGRGDAITSRPDDKKTRMLALLKERGTPMDRATTAQVEAAMKSVDPAAAPLPVQMSPNVAGGLLTTTNDYGRFLRHIVTAKRHGGRAASIVGQLMTPQIRCNEAVQWGLGAGLEDVGADRYAWQWGDNTGFKHFYVASPGAEKAMVAFTNGDRGRSVYERVIRERTGIDHPAFLW